MFCCKEMNDQINHKCDIHTNIFDCADALVFYEPKFDENGIIVHDGGTSYITINYCPWCGTKLPDSKRDIWFDTLEQLGYNPPYEDIPEKYNSDEWFRK